MLYFIRWFDENGIIGAESSAQISKESLAVCHFGRVLHSRYCQCNLPPAMSVMVKTKIQLHSISASEIKGFPRTLLKHGAKCVKTNYAWDQRQRRRTRKSW